MDFQVSQDPMACRECLESQGRKDHREEMELKEKLVTRVRKECWDKLGEKGNEGSRGNSGQPGKMGIKGARGVAGDQGIKGDKGEKGEDAVLQTNWKQCVWKNLNDDRDSGKIKVRENCSDWNWFSAKLGLVNQS